MSQTLTVSKLICRGRNAQNPKIWDVWGTSRGCDAIDVSFALPPGVAGVCKIVTAVPRAPRAEGEWLKCEAGEQIWLARFYLEDHPGLSGVRPWLQEQADRAIAIEARTPSEATPRAMDANRRFNAGDPPADEASLITIPATATASRSFHESDIVTGYECDAGVLLVHGIGMHPQGDTLVRFGDPLVQFLQRWLRPVSARWAATWSAQQASQWSDGVYASTLRNQQDLFDLTDEIGRVVESARKGDARGGPTPPPGVRAGFVAGDACAIDTVMRPLPEEPEVVGSSLIRLSTAGPDGALEQRHLMMREAWWTDEVVPPGMDQLDAWIVTALPQVVSTYFGSATRALHRANQSGTVQPLAARATELLDILFTVFLRGPAALVFCVLAQLILGLLRVLLLIPLPWLRAFLAPIVTVLMGTTGQSYAVVTSELRRSAIVFSVSKHLDWLCERCERVIVLAHSQGAEVSRMAIAQARRPELEHFYAFGSGIKMLNVLMHDPPAKRHAVCAGIALVVLLVAATGGAVYPLGATAWQLAYAALVTLGTIFLWPPDFRPTFRRSVPMTEFYASSDPVPCGPLITDEDELARVKFRMIEVRNRASVLFDHTSYLDNTEQFVAPVALALAELAGMNWFDLIEGDAHRLVEAQRRRCALVARKQWIGRWGLAAVLIGSLAAYLAGPWSPGEAFGVLRTLWNGPTLQEWGTALRHLPHALVAALPVAIAAALFVVERILLHLRFESSANELTNRVADAPLIPHWAVRVVGYGAGIAGIAWWIDHVDLVSAVARRLAG